MEASPRAAGGNPTGHDLPTPCRDAERLLAAVAARRDMSPDDLRPFLYIHRDGEAARHLSRVASGLDSLLVGEYQVLGQVKTAFQAALDAGTAGPTLSALFRQAIHAGKRVRTETEIGLGARSLGLVAATLARETLGDLARRTALIVGAGKMSELAGRALAEAGLRFLLVSNRTFDKAAGLAASLGGEAVHFDALPAEPGPGRPGDRRHRRPPYRPAPGDPGRGHGRPARPPPGGGGPGGAAQRGPGRPLAGRHPPVRHGRSDGRGECQPPGGRAGPGGGRGDRRRGGRRLSGVVAAATGRPGDHGPARPGRGHAPGRGGQVPSPAGPADARAGAGRGGAEPGPGEQGPAHPHLPPQVPGQRPRPGRGPGASPRSSSGWTARTAPRTRTRSRTEAPTRCRRMPHPTP